MLPMIRRPTVAAVALACGLCAMPRAPAVAQAAERPSAEAACPTGGAAFAVPQNAPYWNGWGVDSAQHRFQPAEMAQLAAPDVPRLKLKWAFGFPGATRAIAQPTVVGGRLFVGSQSRTVYALDAKTGCVYWQYEAAGLVRASISVAQEGERWLAYFADSRANIYAVDAVTGQEVWQRHIDEHAAARVTGAPLLIGSTLFVPVSSAEEFNAMNPRYVCCSFRGSVVALNTATGTVQWKSYTIGEEAKAQAVTAAGVQRRGPSGVAIWSSPTYDPVMDMVYIATGDNYSDPPTETSDAVLAFKAASGELAWSRQMTAGDAYNMACIAGHSAQSNCPQSNGPDLDFGSSPILVALPDGKRLLIAGQKSGVVTALDPDQGGKIVWQKRVGHGGRLGGVQWGPASDGVNAYVAVSDLKLNVVSPDTPGAQPFAASPSIALLADNAVGGGLSALKLATGEEVWHTPHPGCHAVPGCSPAQSAAVTAMPGIVFSGGLDGHLRAYSTTDGRIVWDVDTRGEHATVNGIAARGGSIDGGGVVVVDGTVYVSSGSAAYGTMPGNVLLAFTVDGR
jgi:polyvinyl alcohol dehydrogenase (cytochrome)